MKDRRTPRGGANNPYYGFDAAYDRGFDKGCEESLKTTVERIRQRCWDGLCAYSRGETDGCTCQDILNYLEGVHETERLPAESQEDSTEKS